MFENTVYHQPCHVCSEGAVLPSSFGNNLGDTVASGPPLSEASYPRLQAFRIQIVRNVGTNPITLVRDFGHSRKSTVLWLLT